MSSVPIDQQIIDYLVVLLQRIRIDNGFRTDAGLYVLSEEAHQLQIPDSAMTLAVFDTAETTGQQGYKRRRATLGVAVQASIPRTLKAPPDAPQRQPVRMLARAVMADIRDAVAAIDLREFGGPGVTEIRITGRQLPLMDDGASAQLCQVTYEFDFTETHPPKEIL